MTYYVTQHLGRRRVSDQEPNGLGSIEGEFQRMEDAFHCMQKLDAKDSRKAVVATTLLYTFALLGFGYWIGSLPEAQPRATHEIVQSESAWEPDYSPPQEHTYTTVVEPCREHKIYGCID